MPTPFGNRALQRRYYIGWRNARRSGPKPTLPRCARWSPRAPGAQAVLLGLAATISHTSVVWVLALIGVHFASQYNSAVAAPYCQMASAFLIIVIALWMLGRTGQEQLRLRAAVHQHAHRHDHGQHHSHRDAHVLAHADKIRRRFVSGNVTTGQIVMFGLSGGLIPCSAAIAVLALCLQVNHIWLGIALVLCLSIGLAITLIAAGMTAALGMPSLAPLAGFGRACRRPMSPASS